MKFDPIKCPKCREHARGTVDLVYGVATFTSPDENGEVAYAGETEIFWDSQETLTDTNANGDPCGIFLSCPNGHEWTAKEVSP